MAKKPGPEKTPTSVRLTPEAKRLWKKLADQNGITQAAWMEMTIRKEARQEGVS